MTVSPTARRRADHWSERTIPVVHARAHAHLWLARVWIWTDPVCVCLCPVCVSRCVFHRLVVPGLVLGPEDVAAAGSLGLRLRLTEWTPQDKLALIAPDEICRSAAPPSTFSRCINSNGERASAE